jgi:hypothetical protein
VPGDDLDYAVMRDLRPSDWSEVVLVWLRSEGKSLNLSTQDRERLIEKPDLMNQADNIERSNLLRNALGRHVIIDRLGTVTNMNVKLVDVEVGDLPNLYIVPTPHWYLDTGGNFRLSSVETNLKPGRKIRTGSLIEDIEIFPKVDRLKKQLRNYAATTTDEMLMMISTSDAGPYIIIDRNHRAAALYLNNLSTPNTPWRGLLITDPVIANSQWYINSPAAQSVINIWKSWAALGKLI